MALTSFIVGVCTATAGAWIASKFHVYNEARNRHHSELKKHVLEPIRDLLQKSYDLPDVRVEWNRKQYNTNARAQDDPIVYGPLICIVDPGLTAYDASVEMALLQDARSRHYEDLICSWERFRASWTKHLADLREWIESMSQDILAKSGLPAFVGGATRFIQELATAEFVYGRCLKRMSETLQIRPAGDRFSLTDGGNRKQFAGGRNDEIQNLHNLVNTMLRSEAGRAEKLTSDLNQLISDRKILEARFSEALMMKTLPKKCPFVSFRAMLLRL